MTRRDALAGLFAMVIGCGQKRAPTDSLPKADAAAPTTVPATHPDTFMCPRCSKSHKYGEPGFNWPDAIFALSLPDEEKHALKDGGNNEDVAIVRGAHFVRAVLFVPVAGWSGPLGIGFWIRISPADYRDFERRKRLEHPVYSGELANQATFLGPTLGLRASMAFQGAGLRPMLKLLDSSGALAQAQSMGVSDELARGWLAETVHDGEAEPKGPARTPQLQKDGYRLVTASESGRPGVRLPRRPSPGDLVKVVVEFLASDEKGIPKPTVAGWWLKLDDVGTTDTWSGTLENPPRVPAPISRGARFWIRPEHIIEFTPSPK